MDPSNRLSPGYWLGPAINARPPSAVPGPRMHQRHSYWGGSRAACTRHGRLHIGCGWPTARIYLSALKSSVGNAKKALAGGWNRRASAAPSARGTGRTRRRSGSIIGHRRLGPSWIEKRRGRRSNCASILTDRAGRANSVTCRHNPVKARVFRLSRQNRFRCVRLATRTVARCSSTDH